MSDKTSAFLHALAADAFKREVDADEAVWRSLPFFAALAGLGLAVLPGLFVSLASGPPTVTRIVALALFAVMVIAFTVAAYWFWQVLRPRRYDYPDEEAGLIAYADALQELYIERGAKPDEADAAVLSEVRTYVTEQLARAVATNRANNIARTRARGQVLLFVAAGFVLAFLAEATILSGRALSWAYPGQAKDEQSGRTGQAERRALARDPRGSAPNHHAAADASSLAGRQPVAVPSQQVPAQTEAVGSTPAPAPPGREGHR